jgi:hypothetical protein
MAGWPQLNHMLKSVAGKNLKELDQLGKLVEALEQRLKP